MADSDPEIRARIATGVAALPSAQWDALAGDGHPFTSHAFLSLLEESGSVGPGTGWQPVPLLIEGDAGLRAAAPAYLKTHSQGEYVFDQGWAEAWQRAGGDYYPKLQISVPFTPATGPRLLATTDDDRRLLIRAMETLVADNGLSSAHATFLTDSDLDLFREADWLIREDVQFHWIDRGYGDFAGFLGALSSRKRKAIRKERDTAQSLCRVEALTGDAIRSEHWDLMWACYQDTGARKWGRPYLTRAAFDLIGERMADEILLAVAYLHEGDVPVAAAINFIGGDTLYGRYWGSLAEVPCLHFELCYYQAIDFALANGLTRVEAGAQGSHKLARGYEPVATWSAHYIPHPGFRAAVADFLARETPAVEDEARWLAEKTPFKRED
jgi:predicted N-acyltransferase